MTVVIELLAAIVFWWCLVAFAVSLAVLVGASLLNVGRPREDLLMRAELERELDRILGA